MRIALIADTFPPLRNSGAVQLRDLAREFIQQGHELTVVLPAFDLAENWQIENVDGVRVIRLLAPKSKDIRYLRRTLAEFVMPYAMKKNLSRSPLATERWDGVIWYSPSIFHGPLVKTIKETSGCPSLLIIRDIFPEWAVDMGLIRDGIALRFFRSVARYQYSVADIIGVQSAGNLSYFDDWKLKSGRTLDVLQNWLGPPGRDRCRIRINDTTLAGRRIFVYAGNMGVAQNMGIVVNLAERLKHRHDAGFLLVGRGREVERLKEDVVKRDLDNVLFFDEIDPDEIPDLYNQCHVGIVSLDPRHRSHNIPGKFLTYMQSGLPVLANLNPGNDLVQLISEWGVGEVCESGDLEILAHKAERLISTDLRSANISERCRQLFADQFSVTKIVRSIVRHLENHPSTTQ